ncbi:MAG: UDP-glucose-undecaprenyl-phosphate glucosyltransferase [Candidatus Amesbacteria bacterium GW2011_GWA2_47_11b]|uniref:dolichyl-phosphate beta-glucosyltransferase n=3 Tax=Candidatus Amesiibacteriota TaxID=1752730 RepID=A0A0G1VIU9_9BACT|nr:MAG: UDP-glucose-undecaprenyl-phosphate glucosyltransferase [Microgenomates group bacterium GW2011_GWC1_46_20]KKU57978.1 MAG: UDP-glucose-undecaprenyl-phosphate glucosyltransferase [Candidatus Amesbacteria bacterium GW2011_GWA2_47_11b]KKU69995.1 MAG: UDP-glucose-undecaprenyl-phosphate glucosyltransferase [Candidatus Amesbacteria bacterium GW2011_GWA1_47_20]KKU84868.1 MAG: UDP-glucose-undecaprenyl-phosphate glucosyltransferase [Candidatus Amesbacteria bacterium GW2011_GWC2_47_8]
MFRMLVTIIFPAFNEEKRLKNCLEKTQAYLNTQGFSYEVIVINDGSHDATGQILADFQKRFHLKIINCEKNLGKGAAIKTGVMAARGDFILFSDVDLSVPIETLTKFLEKVKGGFDVVIGSRRVKGVKILTHQSDAREFMGHAFTKISNLVLGTSFADFTCGFKLFNKKAAKKIFALQRIDGWAFDAEVLFLARKLGFKVSQMGIVWSDVKDSKVHFPQDAITSLLGLLEIRLSAWRGYYFLDTNKQDQERGKTYSRKPSKIL